MESASKRTKPNVTFFSSGATIQCAGHRQTSPELAPPPHNGRLRDAQLLRQLGHEADEHLAVLHLGRHRDRGPAAGRWRAGDREARWGGAGRAMEWRRPKNRAGGVGKLFTYKLYI